MILQSSSHSSSLISSIRFSPRGHVRASQHRHHVRVRTRKNRVQTGSSACNLCSSGRRGLLEAADTTSFLPPNASRGSSTDLAETLPTQRPEWYQELFAWFLNTGMRFYEAEIADYKRKVFANLTGKAEKILEIGIGTGPNLKYYAGNQDICVLGVDPNPKMEKYARESAAEAGLEPENFRFIHAVGEAIPLDDASVDAVVVTLVLCSVPDVAQTLNEIKRVMKPGGLFIFFEHVAAEDGSFFRYIQNLMDPAQQVVCDGCHLTRNTAEYISKAGFEGGVEINAVDVYSFPWIIRPHVYGIAYK